MGQLHSCFPARRQPTGLEGTRQPDGDAGMTVHGLHTSRSNDVGIFWGVYATSVSSQHTPHLSPPAKKSCAPIGTVGVPSSSHPCLMSLTLAAIVVGVGGPRWRWEWVGGWARAQSCDHLHDIGHDHLARTHGLKPLRGDAVRVILNV